MRDDARGLEVLAAALDAGIELLRLSIAVARCLHPAGPPVCWYRKPLPGLALWLARELGFDLAKSVHVGKGAADRGFALRAAMTYRERIAMPSAEAKDPR